MVQLSKIAGLGLMLAPVYAHPGHDVEQENLERRAYYNSVPTTKRSLSHCAASLKARALDTASLGRRALNALPVDAPLKKRSGSDLSCYQYSHNNTDPKITVESSESDLFSNSADAATGSCILVPEAISGPYYVTGEMIRRNITEGAPGIPMTLALQFIDVNSCEPVPDIYVDVWNANSTGVYSGVVVAGNGDISDTANINTTALRGIGLTDRLGVTTFDTIFPGHYTGRTNHLHLISHSNSTTYLNNTIAGGNITHVGQLYFDEDLISTVESTYPYNTNEQVKTYNSNDTVLIVETDTPGVDPFVKYAYIGDDITDGLLAWVTVGIDVDAASDIAPGGSLYKTGGVTDPGNLAEQESSLINALIANGQTSLAAELEAVAGIATTAPTPAPSTMVTSTTAV